MTVNSKLIENLNNDLPNRLAKRNLKYVSVGWEDCTRAKNSCIGKNISDWTFVLKDGKFLKYIRHPNFSDRTLTVSTDDICVIVGNETLNGELEPITLKKYLKNYSKYNLSMPANIDLSNGEEKELVSIRYIAVIVPVGEDGRQEVAPTCYSYNTTDNDNPNNYISSSFHLGTGSRTDSENCQNVFLVKTNEDGSRDDCWFKITSEENETAEEKSVDASVLGTRSTGTGRDRVMCFQIPRKPDNPYESESESESDGEAYEEVFRSMGRNHGASKSVGCSRGLSTGNVSFGSKSASNSLNPNIETHFRDTSQNITLTFAKYYTTNTGLLSDDELNLIVDNLDEMYKDSKTEWDGSLVTGVATDGSNSEPSIKLPNLTDSDVKEFIEKTNTQPKSMSVFPE
jgi:hypothetical protein